MNRRGLLSMLAGLPFMGWARPKTAERWSVSPEIVEQFRIALRQASARGALSLLAVLGGRDSVRVWLERRAGSHGKEQAIDYIRRLRVIEWVSVADRLPPRFKQTGNGELCGRFIVCWDTAIIPIVSPALLVKDRETGAPRWADENGHQGMSPHVTHWAELPAPPTTERA